MKAARISAPKTWEIVDIDTPTIGDGQCLIKLEKWSVCGSDIPRRLRPGPAGGAVPVAHRRAVPRVRRHDRRETDGRVPSPANV